MNDAVAHLLAIENYQAKRQFHIDATAAIFLEEIMPERIIKSRTKRKKSQGSSLTSKLSSLIREIEKAGEHGNFKNQNSRYFAETEQLLQKLDKVRNRYNLLTPLGMDKLSYGD